MGVWRALCEQEYLTLEDLPTNFRNRPSPRIPHAILTPREPCLGGENPSP